VTRRAAKLYAVRFRDATALLTTLATLCAVSAFGADEFLGRHWRRPLAPQGPPPARYSPLEA